MRLVAAIAVTLAVLVTVLGGPSLAQSPAGPPVYVVIVNPNNPAGSADRQFLEDAFLKKITAWPNGEVIRPADLAADSAVRRSFTRDVLNRSAAGGHRVSSLIAGIVESAPFQMRKSRP